MSDERFTQIVRDLVAWGLEGGHTTKARLKEVEGLSERNAAKQLGVSRAAVRKARGTLGTSAHTEQAKAKSDDLTPAGTSIVDGAATNGFSATSSTTSTVEESAEARKAQHAMLEAAATDAPAKQIALVQPEPVMTIQPHAEPADIARRIIDAFGGERAASIAREILRAAGIPGKDGDAPKRTRGRPPGSKNKPKGAPKP